MGDPKGEESGKGKETLFKKVMVENIQNLEKDNIMRYRKLKDLQCIQLKKDLH